MNNGWISVNQRVPNDGKVVIVSNGNYVTSAYYGTGGWITNHGVLGWEVNHWMPLPDPPAPPDPFEEWWKQNKSSTSCLPEGYRLIGGYNTPKCTARFIWDAALKSKEGK